MGTIDVEASAIGKHLVQLAIVIRVRPFPFPFDLEPSGVE